MFIEWLKFGAEWKQTTHISVETQPNKSTNVNLSLVVHTMSCSREVVQVNSIFPCAVNIPAWTQKTCPGWHLTTYMDVLEKDTSLTTKEYETTMKDWSVWKAIIDRGHEWVREWVKAQEKVDAEDLSMCRG